MALPARPIASPATPNIASGHMPSGGRNVATSISAPVEELSPTAEIFADANFNFQGFTEWMQARRQQQTLPSPPQSPPNPTSNFDTTSSMFLHLLHQHQGDGDSAAGQAKGGPGFHQALGKAIRAYEGTAEVIGNAPKHLGTSVSFAL